MRHHLLIRVLLSCSVLIGSLYPSAPQTRKTTTEPYTDEISFEEADVSGEEEDYGTYLARHGEVTEKNTPDEPIVIEGAAFQETKDCSAYVRGYQGREACLYYDEPGGCVTWEFSVAEEGYYLLDIEYCPISGQGYDIVVDIALDGRVPFRNARNINLHRLFTDETYYGMDDNAFQTSSNGDEIRPAMTELFTWMAQTVTDPLNQYTGGLYFYLEKGSHTFSLGVSEETAAFSRFIFHQEKEIPSYEETVGMSGREDSHGILEKYEAEKSFEKNHITLFATYDNSSVSITPASPEHVRYNTIGKNTWKNAGQEIRWEFEVPEDGYYYLAFKVKQNTKNNAYSTRQIMIDGSIPCQEAAAQKFPYSSRWYIKTMENEAGEPLKVYLTKGRHVLGMRASMDEEMASLLRNLTTVTSELQGWYREIIKVTGFNADATRQTVDLNRDFELEKNIPGLMEGLTSCRQELDAAYEQVGQIQGISTSSASILKELSTLLDGFLKHPRKIPKRLETYRSDVSTLATWTIDMQDQPLTMDNFYVFSPDVSLEQVSDEAFQGFFAQTAYRFRLFLHSFQSSATSIGGSEGAGGDHTEETDPAACTLRIWISTADITTTGASSGRDQAILLKRLIDENFTGSTGIRAEISLVSGSDTLVQAVLAGEGPDCALFTSVDTPVNLAMRGMLLELSQFEGCEEVLSEFTESAVTPFYYKDGLYAFPETQNFNVIFYRTDVYEELGLTPPKTWEEFYKQIVELSNHNYMVGVPQNQNTFETFLYQYGTTFFTQDLSRSTFDTAQALEAFTSWTDLYTKYSLPLTFDFFNRFRSGEMAMAIMPYNQVNYLYSAAPELDGLWGMAVIPKTVREDGTESAVETSTSTGCIALGNTSHPQEAYDFLKWWVSAETQAAFGNQVEQNLGIAARYGTANLKAFEQLPWIPEQADVIRRQREQTVAIEQIPGSYYIARNLSFAFRAVVYNKANTRETLYRYNIEINKELARKQQEFSYSH